MRNFNQNNRGGNKGDFRQRDFSGRGMDRQMYKTTCSACGNECEVPFQPTGDRPVFCNNCFEKKDPGNPGGTMTEIQEGVITPIQKCIVLFATVAVTNVRFPSNRQVENRFIAKSVLRKVAVRTTKIPNNLRNSLINYTSSLTRF